MAREEISLILNCKMRGPQMTLKYESGEEVRLGDQITFGGRASTVELVVGGLTGDPLNDWEFETNGPGVLVVEVEPKVFGRLYLRHPETKNDLLFISRATQHE